MIKLVNLSKYYYGNNTVALGLRKVNLEFHTGEFVAITGESGSGKTTLLSTLSGLLPYEEGEMYFNGNATSYYDEEDWEEYRKNHIAFVFQNYNLIDSYTALENVMTSFLIQGEEVNNAKEKAMALLEQVGIAEYATHRATELSSGQKQRLSIARALAKNTEVIVADEPTGNLDAENGRQIMELFAELAKEKLVLVVTHNYEEASSFVTRKIVIHDGEVEEDISLRATSFDATNKPKNVLLNERTEQKEDKEIAWTFALMNMKSRIGKSVFLSLFLFVISVAYFLFLGNFVANLDDTATKIYVNSAFYNEDNTRIIVRHPDGSAMTEKDLQFLDGLNRVVYTEKYSMVNDLYYFSEKGVDYQVTYTNIQPSKEADPIYQENIYLDSYTKFMRSSYSLTEDDLAYGRLPCSTNEVVIYAEDDSLLGSTFSCFFSNKRDWQMNVYVRMEMTVCGILKEETNQTYFSEELCKTLNNDALGYENFYSLGKYSSFAMTILYTDDSYNLSKYSVVVSKDIYEARDDAMELALTLYHKEQYETSNRISYDGSEAGIPLVEGTHNSCKQFMIVSSELYDELFSVVNLTQAAVFIEDYAYMDDVLKEIRDAGYEAVAPYRIGSVSYDDEKVTERLVTLGVSLVALIVLFVLEVIIVMAFMKTDKKSAIILKSIGLKQKTLSLVNGFSLITYNIIAFVLMLLTVFGLGVFVPQINNLLIYYRIYHIVILFAISMMAVFITIYLYNSYLARLLKVGSEVQE